MAMCFLSVLLPSPSDVPDFTKATMFELLSSILETGQDIKVVSPEVPEPQAARLRIAMSIFDRNHNGKLDADERQALLTFLESRMQ
jgi:hypothetical protein